MIGQYLQKENLITNGAYFHPTFCNTMIVVCTTGIHIRYLFVTTLPPEKPGSRESLSCPSHSKTWHLIGSTSSTPSPLPRASLIYRLQKKSIKKGQEDKMNKSHGLAAFANSS